jgi:hypothetical protein
VLPTTLIYSSVTYNINTFNVTYNFNIFQCYLQHYYILMLPTTLIHFKLECVMETIRLVFAVWWYSVFPQIHIDMYINTLKPSG